MGRLLCHGWASFRAGESQSKCSIPQRVREGQGRGVSSQNIARGACLFFPKKAHRKKQLLGAVRLGLAAFFFKITVLGSIDRSCRFHPIFCANQCQIPICFFTERIFLIEEGALKPPILKPWHSVVQPVDQKACVLNIPPQTGQ